MRRNLFIIIIIGLLPFSKLAAQMLISKDSAFKKVQRLFENKPFVHEGSIYKIYEMKLAGDTLQYKLYIEDQDHKNGKVYKHRSYDILLKNVDAPYFTNVAENLSWVTFSTESHSSIRETILPEPKPKMIALPVSCGFTNKAYLPVEFSKPEYVAAIAQLKALM